MALACQVKWYKLLTKDFYANDFNNFRELERMYYKKNEFYLPCISLFLQNIKFFIKKNDYLKYKINYKLNWIKNIQRSNLSWLQLKLNSKKPQMINNVIAVLQHEINTKKDVTNYAFFDEFCEEQVQISDPIDNSVRSRII